ncbi:sulfatase family protein [Stratiformator vulcanicus]|nr:sulfatase [Stratiformator vulcanicus]
MKISPLALLAAFTFSALASAADLTVEKIDDRRPKNVIFVLSDDHRFDAMGFLGKYPWLKTPNMDRLASEGVHFPNAFVTTSLCSPSRASILTGQYMHKHGIVDNNVNIRSGTRLFPEYLQEAGYQTAFVGKWHMGGHGDDPQPGFDHWVSFRGQGHYNPGRGIMLNIDGKRTPQKGYITDELTDHAINWLDETKRDQPFFLYLSHKAVHADFSPAERHKTLYEDVEVETPVTQADTEENYHLKPRWVRDQRNSWHGVDFPYHSTLDVKEYFKNYCRALKGVDESLGRVLQWLDDEGVADDTLVLYMGDNGFLFGEHGLIDKRNAYEESMRVPLLGRCSSLWSPGQTVESVVANIDIGPTVLAAAGVKTPQQMDGASFLDLQSIQAEDSDWRDFLLYEYYWEFNFPQTPTTYALRGEQYKFIQYHGIWDCDELYDLKADPNERDNLIFEPEHKQLVDRLRKRLYKELSSRGAARVPFSEKENHGRGLRIDNGKGGGDFPKPFIRDEPVNRNAS